MSECKHGIDSLGGLTPCDDCTIEQLQAELDDAKEEIEGLEQALANEKGLAIRTRANHRHNQEMREAQEHYDNNS